MKKYDAIIIGAGQAGVPLAKKLALSGKKTVIIEKRFYGGTCVNDGCTPTKTWVASAKAAYMAGKSDELGINIQRYTVNMKQIKKRKDEIVLQSRNGSLDAAKKIKNLDILFGEAIFTDHKTILVNLNSGETQALQGELIFINTGAKPFIPEIEGLNKIEYLTSTTILDLNKVPKELLILGGNYIGLEFGQMFSRFGSTVTILEKSDRIIPREDKDISTALKEILEEEKITVYTDAQAIKFKQPSRGGKVTVTISVNGTQKRFKTSNVLVATGRVPQTSALDLYKTGVLTDEKGYIKVNQKLETNVPGIYALGDVKGGPAFTHISYNDYTIVYRNLIEGENLSTKGRLVPYCMFTDPQLGRVGISEKEAKDSGLNYKVATLPMAHVARAIETGDTRGLMKAIVDAKTKKILGAAVLGPEGGEIMTILQMAMEGGITYDKIRYGIFAHPLYAESLNNLFMTLDED